MQRLSELLASFIRDRRGNFATMFIVLSVPLFLAASLSLDTARMFAVHNKLTFAVDAAALATTQGLTLGDISLDDASSAVRKYLDANLDGRSLQAAEVTVDSITVDKVNRSVQIKAHAMMPMTFTGIVGYDRHRVDAVSKAQYSNTEVEVVMALDVTGSMGNRIGGWGTPTKLQALKDAASSGLTTLFADLNPDDRVRVGLVPYSEAVNAQPIIGSIQTTGISKRYCNYYYCWWETTYPDCVRERTGTEKYTDAFATSTAKIGSSDYNCPSSKIVPLSSNESDLKTKISYFSAGGCTAGHLGIAWAYYMLSPNWAAAWPEGSDPEAYDKAGMSKNAIIMTDGEFNTFESNGYYCSSSGTNMSETYALSLCDAMKARNIKIYSIAFKAGSAAETLMKGCASTYAGNKLYYNATDDETLTEAFEEIARDIKGLRLVN